MTGRGKKQKGKRGEREAAELIRSFGWQARRGMSFLGEPDLVTDFPMHVEVKYQERLNIFAALEQAENYVIDKGIPYPPCVLFRKNEGQWQIAIPAAVLFALMKLMKTTEKVLEHEQTS